FREQMAQAFGVGAFGPLEDQVRRNMEMFEKTFAMFAPFARGQAKPSEKPQGSGSEMDELKRQLDEMQKRLDKRGEQEESLVGPRTPPHIRRSTFTKPKNGGHIARPGG